MKAMILAAGLGTRLRPLSDLKPKALMPVANRPVLERNIEYLIRHGVTEIVVNVHHHPEQLLSFLRTGSFQARIETRVEPEILGTGGGIRNTADLQALKQVGVQQALIASALHSGAISRKDIKNL